MWLAGEWLLLAGSSHSDSPVLLSPSVRYWEKQTFGSIHLNNLRFAQNQPLSLSGERLLLPNTGHSDVNIGIDMSGCF
jgi:hypothetical protein